MLNIGKVIKNDLISCFRGEDPADVDRNILDVARRLDTYGITLYPCRVSCEILLAGYGYICTSIVFEVLFLVKLRLVRLRATQFLFFPPFIICLWSYRHRTMLPLTCQLLTMVFLFFKINQE